MCRSVSGASRGGSWTSMSEERTVDTGIEGGEFSGDSILAFADLVVVGSIFAFSVYAWLLKNVPFSKVSTYAYVNPAIAIFLGWLILD